MNILLKFLVYGVTGWCLEIFWTGCNSLIRKDYKLIATTSIWMFFIYGLAVVMEPITEFLKQFPVVLRGGVYVIIFFAVEYLTGEVLKKFNLCPWDYSECKYNIRGVIRLDFIPVWFIAGLIFELVHNTIAG